MKDFQLDSNGDVIVTNNDLQYTSDTNSLLIQKIKTILSTNKGEWKFDVEQGINFKVMLTKNPSKDQIIDTVQDGLHQVDETLKITSYSFETIDRHLLLNFTASNALGDELSMVVGTFDSGERNTLILVAALTAEEVLRSGSAIEAICVCEDDILHYADRG